MKQILLIIALLALAVQFTAQAGENAAERISKSFTVAKGGELEVDISSGDIHLVPWEKNEVLVVVDGLPGGDKDNLKMTQSGNSISVEYRPRWGASGDLRFTVNVPTEFNAKVRTSGGDLVVEGRITGRLNGSTSGGDITTSSIDGEASLKTSGGDITLGTVNGDADVKTSGGDIKIASVGKKLKASTSGGDVLVGDVGGEAELATAGGDVRVGKVSGKASLRTAGGDIELGSANGSADVKTAGGDIVLKKISGSISAKTAGGNIQADLTPAGGASSELTTAGGDVRLAVPSSAKVTIDATVRLKGGWKKDNEKYAIHSEFASTTEDVKGKKADDDADEIHNVYQLNGGGEKITLTTTNGSIYIKKLEK